VSTSTISADGKRVEKWFASLVMATAEALGAKITEDRVRVLAYDLRDYGHAAIVTAFETHRRESKWFPTPSEIIQRIEASPEDRALIAWSALERAAESVGSYRSIELDDPAAADALVSVFGSWAAWCAAERGPEMHAKRQQFFAAYRDARRRFQQIATRLGGESGAIAGTIRLAGLLEASGGYERRTSVDVGRITADGVVEVRQERPALAGRSDVKRLTNGAIDGEAE
jgi:hypothetical protein